MDLIEYHDTFGKPISHQVQVSVIGAPSAFNVAAERGLMLSSIARKRYLLYVRYLLKRSRIEEILAQNPNQVSLLSLGGTHTTADRGVP